MTLMHTAIIGKAYSCIKTSIVAFCGRDVWAAIPIVIVASQYIVLDIAKSILDGWNITGAFVQRSEGVNVVIHTYTFAAVEMVLECWTIAHF